MRKKCYTIVFALLLAVISGFPVFAADGDMSRLTDAADLLSDSEETDLLNLLDEISERQQADIVVVTVDSLEGESPQEYADDFYDYYGYGFGEDRDGILFLISMEERDWYISTTGYGITAVTDAGREYMSEQFTDDLKEGNYAQAFTTFARLCDDFITQAETGEPYDVGNLPKEPFGFVLNLVIALGVGFIFSLIVTGIMRSGLKSVGSKSVADDYVKNDSMKLTRETDLFLYEKVERRKKPKENDSGGSETHTSSSGTTHGGGGGKF